MTEQEDIQDSGTTQIYTRVANPMVKALNKACAELGIKRPKAIATAIEDWLASLESATTPANAGRGYGSVPSPTGKAPSTGGAELKSSGGQKQVDPIPEALPFDGRTLEELSRIQSRLKDIENLLIEDSGSNPKRRKTPGKPGGRNPGGPGGGGKDSG